jgi:hypothetical protein
MIDPREIAALITEDPDIFVEMELSSNPMTSASMTEPSADTSFQDTDSLTSSEITDQAEEISDEETDDEVADEMRKKQEEEQMEKEQRRRMLEPQMRQMDKSISTIDRGLKRGMTHAMDMDASIGGLDTDMAALKTALQTFEKSAF